MSQHPTEGLLSSTLSSQGQGSYQNGHLVWAVLILTLIVALPLKFRLKSNLTSYKLSHWFSSTPKRPEIVYSKWFKDYQPWKHPQPVAEDFKLSESIEPKFRPFKWGPDYQVAMGIRSLDPTEWITLHSSYPSYIRLREARHSIHGADSYRILSSNPSAEEPSDHSRNYLSALEAARSISSYLAIRYPKIFKVEPQGSEFSDDGWGIKKVIRMEIEGDQGEDGGLEGKGWNLLDENEVLQDQEGETVVGDNPIRVAGELLPDDLALLLPDPIKSNAEGISEEYRFIAGSISTAGFWRLKDKIGRTLREIHVNGKVPQYETKLEFPMNKFFSKLHPNKPVERNNYFFQILSTKDPLGSVASLHDGTLVPDILSEDNPESFPISGMKSSTSSIDRLNDSSIEGGRVSNKEVKDLTELSWSHSTNGPESLFDQATKAPKTPEESQQDEKMLQFKAPEPTKDPNSIVMRTERQTLRRLPRSGAILFTIRTYIVPIPQLISEPGIPGRLASAIRSWPGDVRKYKGGELFEEVLLPYLDEKHREQLRDGTCQDEEREREKSRKSYPL